MTKRKLGLVALTCARKGTAALMGVGVLVAANVGCSGSSGPEQGEKTRQSAAAVTAAPAATIHRVVVPATATALSVTTVPNAHCTLAPQGQAKGMELASDAVGEVRFYADLPEAASTEVLTLTCENSAGAVAVQQISVDLGDASTATPASPITPRGTARPALAGDPMSYTQSELVLAGYGLRPDPDKAPDAYRSWLQLAQTPTTRTDGPGVPLKRHNNDTSRTWSGCRTTSSGTVYLLAYATWTVPTIVGTDGSLVNESGFWVGLDGWGINDLVQTGTAQDVLNWYGRYYSYYSWVEFYPNSAQTTYNVNPGDAMTGEVWFGDVNGNPTSAGSYGWYYINDKTINQTWSGSIPIPGGTTFYGRTAEWIMENPDDATWPLADYGWGYMNNLTSLDLAFGWNTIESEPTSTIFMQNGSTLLSSAYCGLRNGWSSGNMLTHWNNYQ